ncbi:hypothetical protein C5167_008937 [Papaver somniferum]|uniref:Uncharacterized protein n=1 Tax=Papaver somniferum TaxID=3469 RepID=A0A4Y7JZ25_PAPSO|nr:hypothetical protein C5167_008937 [Papaver somniferum]
MGIPGFLTFQFRTKRLHDFEPHFGATSQKASSSTSRYLHSWDNIQSEEEWCGGRGSDTMEEIRSRIQQGEDASIKRQWVMTYAFS